MNKDSLRQYWNTLPIGEKNALTYDQLGVLWKMTDRGVRNILSQLSRVDYGDNLILIRSSHFCGFFLSDDIPTIAMFKRECLNRGLNCFSPVKKINRVLGSQEEAKYYALDTLFEAFADDIKGLD